MNQFGWQGISTINRLANAFGRPTRPTIRCHGSMRLVCLA
jgi:hypothetical protein